MGKVYEEITDHLREWVAKQSMFFVASAPLSEDGLVNLSPKGPVDSLQVLDPHTVAYLDLTGSGVETIAHARENGRIVLMFSAFDGPPKIVRLHGRCDALLPGSPGYELLRPLFTDYPGVRAIIRTEVMRISDSCGYSVPRFDYTGERDTLVRWAESRGDDGLERYRSEKNARSLDGLPGLIAE